MKNSILVQNLKCGGCAKTIVSELSKVNGVSEVAVDNESATVSFTSENTDQELLVKDRLKAIGYPAVDAKNSVFSKAKSFVSCASGRMK